MFHIACLALALASPIDGEWQLPGDESVYLEIITSGSSATGIFKTKRGGALVFFGSVRKEKDYYYLSLEAEMNVKNCKTYWFIFAKMRREGQVLVVDYGRLDGIIKCSKSKPRMVNSDLSGMWKPRGTSI